MVQGIESGAAGSLRGNDREYPGPRGVGIRLSEPTDPLLEQMQRGTFDAFARGLHAFDKAHTVMLAEEGIIPREGAAACLRSLLEMEQKGIEAVRAECGGGLHAGETYLIRQLGMEVGGLMHAGRSSWDLTTVSQRVHLRDGILRVTEALNVYRGALLDKAAEHIDTIMPYYTHGNQAQSTTFGHYLHAFACAAERDFERLDLAYQHVNVSPAGAASGIATRFAVNRERCAELLGFDKVSTNTRDPSYAKINDPLWETAATLSLLVNSLAALADDFLLWIADGVDLVQLPDRYCSVSSINAHKRNASAAERIQLLLRSFVVGRTPTSFSPTETVGALMQTAQSLMLAAGFLPVTIVKKDRMKSAAVNSWWQSADLAAVLAQEKGLPWRMAHHIVAIMVRLAEEQGIGPQQVTPELLDRAAVLFLGRPVELSAESMAQALDPVACIQARQAPGSPGPAEMERQIATSRECLAADEEAVRTRRERLAQAQARLAAAVAAITQ